MTFGFCDVETTGISSAFDHPLQFATILTDDAFSEIERVNLRCRISGGPNRWIASFNAWRLESASSVPKMRPARTLRVNQSTMVTR